MARWNRVCEGFVPFSVRPSSRFLSAPRPILSLVHFKGTHTHIDELEDFNYVDISRNNFHYTGSWYSFCLNKLHTCTDPLSVVTEIQTICWSQSVQPVDYRWDLLMYNPESVYAYLCFMYFHFVKENLNMFSLVVIEVSSNFPFPFVALETKRQIQIPLWSMDFEFCSLCITYM